MAKENKKELINLHRLFMEIANSNLDEEIKLRILSEFWTIIVPQSKKMGIAVRIYIYENYIKPQDV